MDKTKKNETTPTTEIPFLTAVDAGISLGLSVGASDKVGAALGFVVPLGASDKVGVALGLVDGAPAGFLVSLGASDKVGTALGFLVGDSCAPSIPLLMHMIFS